MEGFERSEGLLKSFISIRRRHLNLKLFQNLLQLNESVSRSKQEKTLVFNIFRLPDRHQILPGLILVLFPFAVLTYMIIEAQRSGQSRLRFVDGVRQRQNPIDDHKPAAEPRSRALFSLLSQTRQVLNAQGHHRNRVKLSRSAQRSVKAVNAR
jgi:hypothetical protein